MQQKISRQEINRICQKDSTFPIPCYKFRMNLSGVRSKSSQLHRAFFRIAVYFGLKYNNFSCPLVLVVTASHNPFTDNGLKIGLAGEQIIQNYILKQIEDFINIKQALEEHHLQKLIKKQYHDYSQKNVYVGRDKRPNSNELSNIIINQIKNYPHLRVINFGEISTPEIFAIVTKRHLLNSNQPEQLKRLFNSHIIDTFNGACELLGLGLSKRKKICIDFANGIGAISYQSYKDCLEQYFQITSVNNCDFSKVNYQCGPQYVSQLCHPNLPKIYYLDGDCDRILMQVDESDIVNGDNINAILAVSLKNLIDKIGLTNISFGVISDVNVNQGLLKLLQSLNIRHVKAQVGVINLYKQVRKYDVGCYFQNSGHGAIYVKDHIIQTIKAHKNQTIDHKLFIHLYTLSCNSCKGYALHNLLIIQLCQKYLNISGKGCYLYQPNYSMIESLIVPRLSQYKTNQEGQSLIEPIDIANQINQIKLKYQDNCYIIVRVSNTENKIRLGVQGKKQTVFQIIDILKKIINGDLKSQ